MFEEKSVAAFKSELKSGAFGVARDSFDALKIIWGGNEKQILSIFIDDFIPGEKGKKTIY